MEYIRCDSRDQELLLPERQVLQLLAVEFFQKEIAADLKTSKNTAHSYCPRIYDKLHVISQIGDEAAASRAKR